MGKNKKVINATEVDLGKIHFRSKLEESFYKKFKFLGITPEFESKTVTLLEGFRPNAVWYNNGEKEITKTGKNKKIQDWEYTPDFVVKMNGYTFYVEAKGNPNDLWPYKRKMFIKWLETQDKSYFFEVRTIRGLVKSIEEMRAISKN